MLSYIETEMNTKNLNAWIISLFTFLGLYQAEATIIANPSFETGDFSEWMTEEINAYFPLLVEQAGVTPGIGGLYLSDPTDGIYTAMHGFDGVGPGEVSISQDLWIKNNYINFDYRAGWDMMNNFGGNDSTQARKIDVIIEEAGGGTELFRQNVLTADPGTVNLDTGDITASVDVSNFTDQIVLFKVELSIPEAFTGPGFVTIDNFRSSTTPVPEPSSILLMCAGIAGIVLTVKRRN